MRLDVGGINGHRAPDAAMTGQRFENAEPDTLPALAVEPVIDRRIGAILRLAITPTCADPKHVDDARYDAPVIDPVRPTPPAR